MADLTIEAVAKYKADVTDHIRAIQKLNREEEKRHKELLGQLEKQNKGIEKQIERIAKWAAAIGGIGAAWGTAKAGLEEFEKVTRLRAGSAGADIEQLRKATNGLVADTELMRLAANGLNSDFKLTQEQLNVVARSALKFRKDGRDLTEVMERLGDAIREGNVEPLVEFGIVLDKDLDKLGATNSTMEAQQAIIARLRKEIDGAGEDYSLAGDDMQKALIDAKNATSDLKAAIGELVASLAPAIRKFAEFTRMITNIPREWERAFGGDSQGQELADIDERLETARKDLRKRKASGSSAGGILQQLIPGARETRSIAELEATIEALERNRATTIWQIESRQRKQARLAAEDAYARDLAGQTSFGATGYDITGNLDATLGGLKKDEARRRAITGRGGKAKPVVTTTSDLAAAFADALAGARGLIGGNLTDIEQLDRGARFGKGIRDAASKDAIARMNRDLGAPARAWRQIGDHSLPAESFNEIKQLIDDLEREQFAKRLNEIMTQAAPAFNILTGAAETAYKAIVTGSESAGKAVKEFVGQSILAEGTKLAGMAVSESVMALVSLALRDFPGAALHGKAAAAAAGGAVLLGGLARGLGVNKSGPSGRAGAASAGAGAARSVTNTFVIGDGFDTGTARERRQRVQRWLSQSDRGESVTSVGAFA